jgi:phosphate transport system permease protein
MAAFIAATSRGDIPTSSIEYETIFVVAMTLFVVTLALNLVSIRLVRKYRQVYE